MVQRRQESPTVNSGYRLHLYTEDWIMYSDGERERERLKERAARAGRPVGSVGARGL